MNGRGHALLGVALVAAVALAVPVAVLATSSAAGTAAAPDPTTQAPETGAFEVTDAQLRWGVNDESNNRAFAPGTVNFFSAGSVPDPGRGGQTVRDGVWQGTSTRAWWAERGDVRIEKRRPDGDYATATFPGLSTTVDGTTMTGTNGPFSGHQVVIDGGTGEVDTDAGTATIRWKGSFSVLYYSGMTFFTVSDPVLSVTRTGATLRATLGGYATSMEDQTEWSPVPPTDVVLASLPQPDLSSPGGFSSQPHYRGVRYDSPPGGVDQVRTGPSWGAFPASFLAFQQKVGSGAYWYSSGGSADAHKIPSPLTVSYEAGDPIEGPEEPEPTSEPTDEPTTTENPPPPPPPPSTDPTQPPPPPVPTSAPAAPTAPGPTTPDGADAAPVAASGPQPGAVPTVYALASSQTTPDPDSGPSLPAWQWWLGSVLLLGAAALTLLSIRAKGTP